MKLDSEVKYSGLTTEHILPTMHETELMTLNP